MNKTPTRRLSPNWTRNDSRRAIAQGWEIFKTEDDPARAAAIVNGKRYGKRPFELQAVTESNPFGDDDGKAQAHVKARAAKGDKLAAKALVFLKAHSRAEYAAIMRQRVCKVTGKPEVVTHVGGVPYSNLSPHLGLSVEAINAAIRA